MAVVKEGLSSGLSEAEGLLVYGAFEAVGVGFEGEGAGEQVGVLGDGRGIVRGDVLHFSDVLFYAGLLEASLNQVLVCSDEDAGTAFDGGAEGGEVATGLWREEEDDLLGLGWDGDGDAFFADLFLPGFDAGEPFIGRWVGGAAEEGGDEEIFDRLGGREIGVQPDLVAGLEVGDGGDGERDAGAADVDIDLGAGEVKACGCLGGG